MHFDFSLSVHVGPEIIVAVLRFVPLLFLIN